MPNNGLKELGDGATELVRLWNHELARGIQRREKEEPFWDFNESFENMEQYWDVRDGKVAGLRPGQGDETTINKVGAYIKDKRAALAFKNPRAKYIPRKAAGYTPVPVAVMGPDGTPQKDDQGQVVVKMVQPFKLREALINDIISHPDFGFARTITRVSKNSEIGYGAAIVRYVPEFETPLKKKSEETAVLGEDGLVDFSDFHTSEVDGLPLEDDDGELVRKDQIPVWEQWSIDSVSYRKLILDPDGEEDFKYHRWIAMEVIRPLDEVKKDPLLKNTRDLGENNDCYYEEDYNRDMSDRLLDTEQLKSKVKRVRLFYIFDMVNDRMIILSDGHPKELMDKVNTLE